MTDETVPLRFLTPTQVAEELNVKPNQVHALIKVGELRAFQVGGRVYLALLSRLMRIVPAIEGEELLMQPRVSARFVRIADRTCGHRA